MIAMIMIEAGEVSAICAGKVPQIALLSSPPRCAGRHKTRRRQTPDLILQTTYNRIGERSRLDCHKGGPPA